MTAGLILAALDELRAQRLRVVLSALSIVVGITTLTLIVAAGQIGQAAATTALERQTGRPATLAISIQGTSTGGSLANDLPSRIRARAARLGGTASRYESLGGLTIIDGRTHVTQFRGVDLDLAAVRNLRVETGRWLAAGDASRYSPVAVANIAMANEVGLKGLGLPRSVTIRLGHDVSADVVGVVDDGEQQSNLYMLADSLEGWAVGGTVDRSLLVLVAPANVGSFSAELRREAAWWGTSLEIRRIDDPRSVEETVRLFQVSLAAIAALSLVTGGIGILNLGLVTVAYRVREFALRRAFGATRLQIFSLVLIEAVAMTVIAGFIGVLVAYASVELLLPLAAQVAFGAAIEISDLPPFPASAAAVGLLVSAILGVLAGIAPAARATRTSIIAGIRE